LGKIKTAAHSEKQISVDSFAKAIYDHDGTAQANRASTFVRTLAEVDLMLRAFSSRSRFFSFA
jgi:hypothetical protein